MLTRKMGAAAGAALILLLGWAAPAYAHGADAPDATNYRTLITSAPDLPGLEIRTIEAGARLQLTNNSGRNIEVLGYNGEPYLEIRPDGVYENYHSPATYLNITIEHVDPPAHADPTLPPVWQKVSDSPMYRWHDQRTLWNELAEPPAVKADPSRVHRIREWTVPMRVDATPLTLAGTLDWVPPPAPWIWWLASIVGAALVALLGLLPKPGATASPSPAVTRLLPPRLVSAVLAALAIGAGLLGLVYAWARELDAGNNTLGPILGQLFSTQLWTTVTALAAIAAGVYAMTHTRGDRDFALALGAAAAGLFAGMASAAVFHRSIIPVPWSASAGRIVIVAVIALGVGTAAAAMLRLRGAAPIPRAEPADAPALSS